MHAVHGRDFADAAEADWTMRLPAGPAAEPAEALPPPSRYDARRANLPAILGIVAGHAALLAALVTFDVIPMQRPAPKPLVVELMPEAPVPPPPPPPIAAAAPPAKVPETPIVAPTPVVRTEAPAVLAAPPPPVVAPPVVSAPAAIAAPAPAAADGPVDHPDVQPQTLARAELRYPVESRRNREEGTVVIAVLITSGGEVSDIKVRKSSGFERLDDAALSSVRRWRFRAAQKDGQPVMAWGVISIPFQLKA